MADLIMDSKARPIPQVLNDDETSYIPWKGKYGAGFMYIPNGYNETLGSNLDTADAATVMGKLIRTTSTLTSLESAVAALSDKVDNLCNVLLAIKDTDGIKSIQDKVSIEPTNSRVDIINNTTITGTGEGTSGEIEVGGMDTITLFLAVSNMSGPQAINFVLQTKDPLTGNWINIEENKVEAKGTFRWYVSGGLGYCIRVYWAISGMPGHDTTFAVSGVLK